MLGFEESDRHIGHGNPRRRSAVELAVVGMAVDDQVGTVAVYYFGEARGAEERKNFGSFAIDSASDGE